MQEDSDQLSSLFSDLQDIQPSRSQIIFCHQQGNQANTQSNENKQPVINTSLTPYNALGKLVCIFINRNGSITHKYASAFKIKHNTIMTTAHALFNQQTNKIATEIYYFSPQMIDQQSHNFQKQKGIKVINHYINPEYFNQKNKQKSRFDIAICQLQENKYITKDNVIEVNFDFQFKHSNKQMFKICGWSQNKDDLRHAMYEQDNYIEHCHSGVFLIYLHKTLQGYSGAFILKRNEYERFEVIGIHKGIIKGKSYGILLSSFKKQERNLVKNIETDKKLDWGQLAKISFDSLLKLKEQKQRKYRQQINELNNYTQQINKSIVRMSGYGVGQGQMNRQIAGYNNNYIQNRNNELNISWNTNINKYNEMKQKQQIEQRQKKLLKRIQQYRKGAMKKNHTIQKYDLRIQQFIKYQHQQLIKYQHQYLLQRLAKQIFKIKNYQINTYWTQKIQQYQTQISKLQQKLLQINERDELTFLQTFTSQQRLIKNESLGSRDKDNKTQIKQQQRINPQIKQQKKRMKTQQQQQNNYSQQSQDIIANLRDSQYINNGFPKYRKKQHNQLPIDPNIPHKPNLLQKLFRKKQTEEQKQLKIKNNSIQKLQSQLKKQLKNPDEFLQIYFKATDRVDFQTKKKKRYYQNNQQRVKKQQQLHLTTNGYNLQLNKMPIDMKLFFNYYWANLQCLILLNCQIDDNKWDYLCKKSIKYLPILKFLCVANNKIQSVSQQQLLCLKQIKLIMFTAKDQMNQDFKHQQVKLSQNSKTQIQRYKLNKLKNQKIKVSIKY